MGYIDNFTGKVWDWTKPFQRTGKFPLDRSSMFASYDDAVLYAKGDGSDSRGIGATAYIGQIITVWGPNDKDVDGVWVYSLVPHTPASDDDTTLADLKSVGSGVGTEEADNYEAAKTLSEDLVVGQLIMVKNQQVVGEQTFKSGFYIVTSPGNISALDTSTGSSDEIGALSSSVAALETRVGTLENTVSEDVTNLSNLIDEYTGTLTDIDDRLSAIETPISSDDINGLFA